VTNGRAYIASSEGLFVVDVSEPATPVTIGSVETPDDAYDVAVFGEYAYVAATNAGLLVVNVAAPVAPRIVGSVGIGFSRGVAVDGSAAYVAGRDGLTIVDVSDPSSPAILGSVGTYYAARRVALWGNHAYVAFFQGLQIVDVSDATSPTILGQMPVESFSVAVDDSYAYTAGAHDGLWIMPIQCENAAVVPGVVHSRPATLLRVSPNPSFGDARLRFELPQRGPVRLMIYSPTGRHVRTLLNGSMETGLHWVMWDGKDEKSRPVASGIYCIRFEWGGESHVEPITILR